MSTEQPVTTVGETDANQPSTENQTASDNSTTQMTAPSGDNVSGASAVAEARDDEE